MSISPARLAVLALGPFGILASTYAICLSRYDPQAAAFAHQVTEAETRGAKVHNARQTLLLDACHERSRKLQGQLPADFEIVCRAPFILAGDVPAERLAKLHEEAVLPLSRALWRAFFDRKPDEPIVLVALSDEARYIQVAHDLDGYDVAAYAAYYNRKERRIVLNLSHGTGTLAHELSHALVQSDFPDMPEWFDEGLASLHEDTVYSADGLLLIPQPNWRSRILVDALRADELPDLATLIRTQSFRGEGEGLNYACVRGLCLFLHQKGLLTHFYRKFRTECASDPTGLATLREIVGATDDAALDQAFRRWVFQQTAAPAL